MSKKSAISTTGKYCDLVKVLSMQSKIQCRLQNNMIVGNFIKKKIV